MMVGRTADIMHETGMSAALVRWNLLAPDPAVLFSQK